jgi:hypothetical protein
VKLLHCTRCGDIVRLYREPRACHCGRSRGRYVDDTTVVLTGECRALGLDTGDVLRAQSGTWAESPNANVRREPW